MDTVAAATLLCFLTLVSTTASLQDSHESKLTHNLCMCDTQLHAEPLAAVASHSILLLFTQVVAARVGLSP